MGKRPQKGPNAKWNKILGILKREKEFGMTTVGIAAELNITRQATFYQLKKLEGEGLVETNEFADVEGRGRKPSVWRLAKQQKS